MQAVPSSRRSWSRSRTTALVGCLSAVLALGATPSTSGAAPGTETPAVVGRQGADGIGDPYFPADGSGGIDVLHYDVHDRYNFDRGRLSGFTRLRVRATQPLRSFGLDLLLPVRSVRVDGAAARFSKPTRHELRIVPRRPVAAGSTMKVTVVYAGRPARASYLGERNWLADAFEVVTMNEPHMAPWWFPANDHPLDKASIDLHITVPADRRVIANGRLVSRREHGRLATTHWRAREPMAPYLAFFAAGFFDVAQGRSHGRPWYVAVSRQISPRQRAGLMRLMRRTPRITAWLERQVGPYPFSTTGGVVTALPVAFALENQTRPTYFETSPGDVSLVVHEMSHQWFGDSVSLQRWRDIWLNEGFATFLEVRWDETHGGPAGATWLRESYDAHPRGDDLWRLRISDPGPSRIFDGAVYRRGAMTLQALRHRVGERDFWRILRTWTGSRRHGTGSDAAFRALASAVSGEDLGPFFAAWLDTTARPADTAANGLR